ncbi:hypothetical protein J2S17_002626 [Cytobacillus purgationiresistens]|uniref:HNH endonuclease n=1 Tax=Cytobacillus purgationiresistens TaxID=863449 RepID=A0ABU0AJ48_9BACI|nr:hypothetical protein [Cytobacillus purgationiresistens]
MAKRYLEKTVGMGNTILTLNANKLCLLDNYELLIKLYHQQSFINNPDYLVRKDYECSRRRRSRLLALVNDFTGDDREEVLQKFEGKCAFTGKDVPLHFDHIIPLAVGHGGTTKANMLPIWQRINSSKNARNLFEWYEDNGDRFEVKPELFNKAVEYIAGLNGMTFAEYREYVYDCHANPNDNLTEVR